jgi:hypothetical protein
MNESMIGVWMDQYLRTAASTGLDYGFDTGPGG